MNDPQETNEHRFEELAESEQREAKSPAPPTLSVRLEGQFGGESWHSLLANTPVFIMVVGSDYRIRYLNRTDSGLPTEAFIGMSLADFSLPENWEGVRACVDRVFATGKPDFNRSLTIRPDQQEHWYEGYFGPIFKDSGVAAVSVIAVNATAQMLAQRRSDVDAERERDEVEQLRADLVRRESERRLLTLIANLPGIAYRCKIDAEWTMEFISEGCFSLTGYHRSELLQNRVLSFGDLIHPEDRKMVLSRIQEALIAKQHFQFEYRIRTANGEEKWVWEQGVGIYSESGQVDAFEGFITDVTDRKRAEEALRIAHDELERRVEARTADLRKSEERFRSYFEQGLVGMAVSDNRMLWVEVNDRFCEILGYRREELLLRKIADFIHPDDLVAFQGTFESMKSGEIDQYTVERRYVRKDGEIIYLSIFSKVFRLPDGAPDHFLALFADVTERIRAEQKVREANRKLIVTLESITDGFAFINLEWRFEYVNEAAARYLRKTRDEMLGAVCWDLFPESRDLMFHTEFHRAMRENIPVHFEEQYPPLNVWYEAHCYPSAEGLSVYFRDITQRKLDEETLQRDHRTLKYLLQSSDHERQTIAYEIHDGLAQSLAAAIMQFDVYKHRLDKKPSDASKAYEAAMTLLQQSHSEARRLIAGVRPPVLDEAGVVEAIAHLINEQNRKKGPKIEFHSLVDFSRLVPLLENAIYRIIQEGITNVCQHARSTRVRITLLQRKNRLRIEIRDWGIGFDIKKSTEGRFGLTGMRERARLLGGKFHLQSMVGKGTRIVVELPLLERER